MLYNKIVLVWKESKFDHMIDEVPVTYTGEVNKKGKYQ